MDFLELARERYSERFFDSRPIEQEKLDRILEAGRVVPTACNYQPQKFLPDQKTGGPGEASDGDKLSLQRAADDPGLL